MGIYLGKDRFYKAFNGNLKAWIFEVGRGAYKSNYS